MEIAVPKKHWIGVIDGVDDEFKPELWLKTVWSLGVISFGIGQLEHFPEPSFKFYLVTKNRVTCNKLETYLLTEKIRWLNNVKKSFQLNVAYVTYEGIRSAGPWAISSKTVERLWKEECAKLKTGVTWKMIRMVSPFSDELDLLGYVRFNGLKIPDLEPTKTPTTENEQQ